MSLPGLMNKLCEGYYFLKIDMADAHQQVKLTPESQRRLALGTNRRLLFQEHLPYGIRSAPDYFHEIKNSLVTSKDLSYTWMTVSLVVPVQKNIYRTYKHYYNNYKTKGYDAVRRNVHLQLSVEYLEYMLSCRGISK